MKIFQNSNHKVLSLEQFKLFADLDRSFPKPESGYGKFILTEADAVLEYDIPQLYASDYMRFISDGNRSGYEAGYFKRRLMLKKLLAGELVLDNGKYVQKIIDILWLVMEESTWVIPAHNKKRLGFTDYQNAQLPECADGQFHYIDLFSAETGAIVAMLYYFLKDKFEQAVPEIINDKILYTIQQRIIIPFLRFNNMWWMGYENPKVNNWNPWIISNILTATALTEANTNIRQRIFDKALDCLDRFIDIYKPDGGCDEGPAYWGRAGAALFDALEVISDMTGANTEYFEIPLIKNIMDYIRKVHIQGFNYANFADCDRNLYTRGMPYVMRMGIRTKNDLLYNFAYVQSCCYYQTQSTFSSVQLTKEDSFSIYRAIKDIYFMSDYNAYENISYTPENKCYLPDLQIAKLSADNNMVSFIKGGNNDESHNHNDVGNIIIQSGDEPIFIDIGAPTYTRFVFSDQRYTLFPIASCWHNLPVFDGICQTAGKEYKADCMNTDENTVSVEYQSAYPKEANVSLCKRTLSKTGNNIVVTDEAEANSKSVVFNYYMAKKPVLNNNTLTFDNGIKVIITTLGDISVQEFESPDDRAKTNWNSEYLYKLTISYHDISKINHEIKIEY